MSAAETAIAFLETLRIPEGPKAGELLRLAEFQKQFVRGALDPANMVAVLSIARGNAKNEARKAVRSASERQEKPSVFVQPGQPIPFPTIPRCPPGSYMQQVYAEQQRRKEMIRKMEYGE